MRFASSLFPLSTRAAVLAAGYRTPRIEERTSPTTTNRLPTLRPSVCDISGHPGEFFRFPNAESRHDCDYAAGVGMLSASPLAHICGGVPPPSPGCTTAGCGCDQDLPMAPDCSSPTGLPDGTDPNDRDGGGGDLYGDEPWGLDVPRPSNSSATTVEIDTASGIPLSTSIYANALEPQNAIDEISSSFALSVETARESSNARVLPYSLGAAAAGDHIRVALTQFGCPFKSSGSPDYLRNGIQTNFDIAIVGENAGGAVEDVLFISESLHDTKEVVHIKTPKAYASVKALITWPNGIPSCSSGVPGLTANQQDIPILVPVGW